MEAIMVHCLSCHASAFSPNMCSGPCLLNLWNNYDLYQNCEKQHGFLPNCDVHIFLNMDLLIKCRGIIYGCTLVMKPCNCLFIFVFTQLWICFRKRRYYLRKRGSACTMRNLVNLHNEFWWEFVYKGMLYSILLSWLC